MSCSVLDQGMDQAATSPAFDDFLQTGRTGRRNALPDITSANAAAASVSTAQLPDALKKLSCSDAPPNGTVCAGPSTSAQAMASGSGAAPKT